MLRCGVARGVYAGVYRGVHILRIDFRGKTPPLTIFAAKNTGESPHCSITRYFSAFWWFQRVLHGKTGDISLTTK